MSIEQKARKIQKQIGCSWQEALRLARMKGTTS